MMAGNWIKAEKSTMAKPELFKMARTLGVSRYEIYGMLMHFWMWADDLTVDGHVDGIVDADVDALVGHEGFAQALIDVGWLEQTRANSKKPGINIPKFSRHMSESAKKRAVKSERQSRYRSKPAEKDVDASVDGHVDGKASTGATTREEKNKKEIRKKTKRFVPPTEEEVKTYCKERQNNINPIKFFNYYETRGWNLKTGKMKSWKASIRTWEQNEYDNSQSSSSSARRVITDADIELARKQRGEL